MYHNELLKFEKSYKLEKFTLTMPVNEYYENYVNFDITESYCKKCNQYDRNWSCPPFEDNVIDVWTDYKTIDLTLLKLNYNDFITGKSFSNKDINILLNITLFNEKRRILQKLHEKKLNDERFFDAMILSSGYCNICPICTRIDNKSCRYPKNKLYSMESLGALVDKTAKELFDIKIKWINKNERKIPPYLVLLVGLLY